MQNNRGARRVLVPVLALVLLGGLLVAGWLLPAGRWTRQVLAAIHGLGFWGPTIVVGLYVAACLLLLPGSVLTIGTGAVFGLAVGVVTVSIGSTLGAAAAFLVGRYVAREWIEEKLADRPKFQAIDQAVGEQGFRLVGLTRLSPVFPFNLLNYGYGLTGVRFWPYVLGSWIGMLPGTVMYVYIGSLVQLAAVGRKRETTWGEYVLYGLGLAATIAVAILVTRAARRALRRRIDVPDEQAPPAGDPDDASV
jgi:uncharacterized membrane protein YdjX (TVP38/TMEM64 family)